MFTVLLFIFSGAHFDICDKNAKKKRNKSKLATKCKNQISFRTTMKQIKIWIQIIILTGNWMQNNKWMMMRRKKEPMLIGHLCEFFFCLFSFGFRNLKCSRSRFACIRLPLWIVLTNIDLTMIHNSHTDTKRVKLAVKIINKQIAQHIKAAFYEYSFAECWKIGENIFNLVFFPSVLLVHHLFCTKQSCKHTK